VQPTKVGIALASIDDSNCRILDARRCSANDLPADAVSAWHNDGSLSVIALDAPLGWPVALSNALHDHFAGEAIFAGADQLFRRATDKDIYRRLGKQPLDVGANFIARTAKAALGLLDELRTRTGEPIPLAWKMTVPERTSAIEVYPAATIRSSALPVVDYKKPSQSDGRRRIIEALPGWFDITAVREAVTESSDVLDAVLCILAAVDFCHGRAVPPTDENLALKEGWIWAGRQQNDG
jgi:predicted nuclease with RNAse H fold